MRRSLLMAVGIMALTLAVPTAALAHHGRGHHHHHHKAKGHHARFRTHPKAAHRHRPSHTALRLARHAVATPVAMATVARAPSITPTAQRPQTHRAGDRSHVHARARRPERATPQPSIVPFTTAIKPPPSPTPSNTSGADGRQHHGDSGRGGGDHEAQSAGSNTAGAPSGGDEGHDGHQEELQDSGEGRDSSQRGDSADGGSPGGAGQGSSSDNQAQGSNSNRGSGDGGANTSQQGESPDQQKSSGASSSTRTSSSSKNEQSALTEGTKED